MVRSEEGAYPSVCNRRATPPAGMDRRRRWTDYSHRATNLKLVVEYDGTDFSGWQRQPRDRTVQQVLEDAIARITGSWSCVRGSGRTDAGVHARAQVANFRTATRIPVLGLKRGLNAILPGDVSIVSLEQVEDDFDARHSARGKRYVYRILVREERSPFHARYAWHLGRQLDRDVMAAASIHLVGEHDFSAFRASNCERRNPVRIVRLLEVTEDQKNLVVISVEATAFLKNMVRVIAGTLIEVGLGRRSPESVKEALASRDRRLAGRTAPACGLTLEHVFY
ncbi:MAG: tRNA pseudouridine(38-40) synthase TruA [Pseudomonadota bacterium]